MPVSYTIDSQHKLIRTVCTDPLTLQETLDHFRQLQDDPACPGHLDALLDVRKTNRLPDSKELAAIGEEILRVRARVKFGKCAIVASQDAMYGMMRVFEVMSNRYIGSVRVSRDAVEAEGWLAEPLSQSGEKSA